jgi:hypothetical protein
MSRWQAGTGNRLATPANDDPGGVSWLYVTANAANTDGLVKIGLSATPVRRLKTFQTASAIPLKLPHVQEVPANRVRFLEWAVHTALRRHRLSGEHFVVSVEIAVAEVALAIIHHADNPPRWPGAPVSVGLPASPVGRWSAVYRSASRVVEGQQPERVLRTSDGYRAFHRHFREMLLAFRCATRYTIT